MSNLKQALLAQLARFDDEAFAALANRGLLRRARKDLEQQSASLVEETSQHLLVAFGEQRIRFDAGGTGKAQCSCPASGVCQHILAAALYLQGLAQTRDAPSPVVLGETPAAHVESDNLIDALHAALLAITHADLVKHAGKAGYYWAWLFVQDLDAETGVSLGGERHIVIGFRHPRVTLRYMGGGLGNWVADVQSAQLPKQQVAATLAYRRAHGVDDPPPESAAKAGNVVLALGKDHALAETSAVDQLASRKRLRASVLQLLEDCVELGLSHLSTSIHERFATLAVWAQGAEYYRLMLLLRRVADHVEWLLERAGGADEQRLYDELALTYGLVCALSVAAERGAAPVHLVGRARSRYEQVGSLDLLGLGAQAWRSASGFVGLTMLFWSPSERTFHACTDARPEKLRGFDALARYKAPGPWGGLGAPAQATGRLVRLTGAQVNDQGRLSAAESTSANLAFAPDFAAGLEVHADWDALAKARALKRRSLLAEPAPMTDWACLAPTVWGTPQFDEARQTLVWPLSDQAGNTLLVELAYSPYNQHAIERIEQLGKAGVAKGSLLVARLRTTLAGPVAEPLSLIRPVSTAAENPVDALHFDAPPAAAAPTLWRSLFQLKAAPDDEETVIQTRAQAQNHTALRTFKQWLQRQAERGLADARKVSARKELATELERLVSFGYSAFPTGDEGSPLAASLLRFNYLCMQYERLLNDTTDDSVDIY